MLKACPLLRGVQGCIAPPKFPNLQKKSPKLLFASKGSLIKLGILCIFGQRNGSKFREGSSFVRFAPSEVKKLQNFRKMPQKIRKRSTLEKICTLLRRKSLVWAWLKPVKCISLGSKGGLYRS